VMESNERPSKRRRAVSHLFRERPFPMDIIVRTPQEMRRSLERVDPFIHDILQRGKVLYDRSRRGQRVDSESGD
jgi:hypothetical protein